jgi:hypothetical protein
VSERFYNPRHCFAFRGLRVSPGLVGELERADIVMMMSFTDIGGECFLQLTLPGELNRENLQ